MKTALTIAGSDSSGGAGIQADLKTFAACGVYGMSVITAVTAQNTQGVKKIADLSEDIIEAQIDAVFEDIFPDAVKIGMISNGGIAQKIAEKLRYYKPNNIVIDPVMVATSSASLMKSDGLSALIKELLPLADVVTPNIAEAETLAQINIFGPEDMERAAKRISNMTNAAVLVKGGHLENNCDDLLYKNGESTWLCCEKIDNPNTHGTGCTLSSAIASNLARGKDTVAAVSAAKDYVFGAIQSGLELGKGGHGPLNHIYRFF